MFKTLFHHKLTFLFIVFIATSVLSAQSLPYDKIVVNGQQFYTYNVKSGEGLYSIARTFSVTVDEILKHNPDASRGLMNGQVLNIPVNNQAVVAAQAAPQNTANIRPANTLATSNTQQGPTTPVDQNRTFKHTVIKGETVYSLADMYNTTTEEIYRFNPTARDGIYENQVLIIPQRRIISEEKEDNYRYHTILPKETLYSVSKTYRLSPEDVIAANPGLSVQTFQIGKTIRIPFFESNEFVVPYEDQIRNVPHTVVKGETLYSISKKYDVTVEEIEKVNPILASGLKTNMELLIPVHIARIDQSNLREEENRAQQLLRQTQQLERLNVLKVGFLMPFLDETDRMHIRIQEYYEGFLLAVKKMKEQGANVELYVFEIGKGNDTKKLQSLLGTMEMQGLNLIIGGVSDQQIKILSDFSKAYNIKYVIPFSSRNNEVLNNGNIFQVNSPQSFIYSKASDVFAQTFRNANVVFVNIPGKTDKADFINVLQSNLKNENIKYNTVTLRDSLDQAAISMLAKNKENVIVPTSGDAAALSVILDALKKFEDTTPGYIIRLFGYPEWQTYNESYKADYHRFGTYIYSSFFVDENDIETKEFTNNFKNWYSRDPINVYPRYGMLGYDTGLFFLTAMQKFGNKFDKNIDGVLVNSIQFAFNFERVNNWGGFINTGLYLVYYDPNNTIIKRNKSR